MPGSSLPSLSRVTAGRSVGLWYLNSVFLGVQLVLDGPQMRIPRISLQRRGYSQSCLIDTLCSFLSPTSSSFSSSCSFFFATFASSAFPALRISMLVLLLHAYNLSSFFLSFSAFFRQKGKMGSSDGTPVFLLNYVERGLFQQDEDDEIIVLSTVSSSLCT